MQPFGHSRRGCIAPLLGDQGPHLIQSGLDRGLPPYQVASMSIQPFGHNRHGPKIGGMLCPFLGGAGSPCNTMWLGPRPTPVASGILIHMQPFGHNTWPNSRQGRIAPVLGDEGPHLTQGRRDRDLPL